MTEDNKEEQKEIPVVDNTKVDDTSDSEKFAGEAVDDKTAGVKEEVETKAEAEEKAKSEDKADAKADVEKAKEEEKAKKEVAEQAKKEAEEKAKEEAEEKAVKEAEEKARLEKEKAKEEKRRLKAERKAAKKGRGGAKAAVVFSVLALGLSGTAATFSVLAYLKSGGTITIFGSTTDGNSANFTEGSIADVAAKVTPSVVSIRTVTTTKSFFGRSYDSQASGTGIIVSSDGYILTNKHVADGATKISVILDDGTTYNDVELVEVDPLNDVAFLKVKNVSDLKAATLGDSKTISIGQQVIAIGNALGQYQNSVTSGIISGTGRTLTASDDSGTNAERLSDMIQTDAAINPGNSGGPLVNAAGQVIGLNTATGTSAENMGFAIPISSVKGMLEQLIKDGSAKRAYLGVYSSMITPEVAKAYNLPVNAGAYLYTGSYSSIIKDSPAAKAGLKEKDIITAVNGIKIGASSSLTTIIGEYKPGDTVQLTIVRDGNESTVNVELDGYDTTKVSQN